MVAMVLLLLISLYRNPCIAIVGKTVWLITASAASDRIGPDSDHIDPQKRVRGMKLYSSTAWILRGRYLIWAQTYKTSQWILTRIEATNAVASNSSSRTRRETARPRKGADERGGPGADRGRRHASASWVRRPVVESQVWVALHVRATPASVSFNRRNIRGPQRRWSKTVMYRVTRR